MMKLTKLLGVGGVAAALLTAGVGQVPPSEFDFAHVPKHTVDIRADAISGKPDSMRLRGYYLFRDGDHFVLLSHRPDDEGNTFIGNAFIDTGQFLTTGVVDKSGGDEADANVHHMHWSLRTEWRHINGVTFRVDGAKYIVLNLNDDVKQGSHVPAIFVGHDAHKYQSGSGYVLIDLLP